MKFIKIIALMLILTGSENALLGSNRITARNVRTGKNKRTFLSATTLPAIPAQKKQSSVKKKPAAPAPQANATASTWVPEKQAAPKRVKLAAQQRTEQTKTNGEELIQAQKNAPPKKAASENTALTLATPAQTMNTVALAAATACAMASAATSACAAPKTDDAYQATMLELFGEDWQLDSPKAPHSATTSLQHSAALQQSSKTEKTLRRKAQLALVGRKSTVSKINGEIIFLPQAYATSTSDEDSDEIQSGDSDAEFESEQTAATQQNQPRIPCTVCHKTFKTKDSLNIHKRLIHGVKKLTYPCDLPGCDKSFTLKTNLKRHKARHSRQESDKLDCPQCEAKLSCKDSLTLHLKKHQKNKNKEFICNVGICKDSFETENSLNRHKSSAHNRDAIECNTCKLLILPRNMPLHKKHMHNQ